MALAADESSLSAQLTSAPGTCLDVTRKGTPSRIWELVTQVKINRQKTVRRHADTPPRRHIFFPSLPAMGEDL